MSAVEITTAFIVFVSFASSVIVPVYLNRRAKLDRATEREELEKERREMRELENKQASSVTMQSVAQMLKLERDSAVTRSERLEAEHQKLIERIKLEHIEAITRMKSDCQDEIDALKTRTRTLETEVTGLYRQLNTSRTDNG